MNLELVSYYSNGHIVELLETIVSMLFSSVLLSLACVINPSFQYSSCCRPSFGILTEAWITLYDTLSGVGHSPWFLGDHCLAIQLPGFQV